MSRSTRPRLPYHLALAAGFQGACTAPADETAHPPEETGARDTGPGDEPASYGIATLNLHCLRTDGTSFSGNPERFEAIAAFLAAEDVALLAAQEACKAGEDAVALLEVALEEATGEPWSSAWEFAHVAWEGTADQADEGVALFARGALEDVQGLQLGPQGGLRRVILGARVGAALGSRRFVSVHIDHEDAAVRLAQARQVAVAALVQQLEDAEVLALGDFNAVEGSEPWAAMVALGWEDLAAGLDPSAIDHVFAHRGAAVRAEEARIVFTGDDGPRVSDHEGVLVRLGPGEGDALDPTVVDALAEIGEGHWLSLRGDTAPLDWGWGWGAVPVEGGRWRFASTELPAGSFAYKFLLDDATWQQGEDAVGQGGEENEVAPAF